MKKSTNKRAIALISLVMVIMVLTLLAGMVTYVSVDLIKETKKITFATDTETIYDAVQEYYTVNGDIPVLDNGAQFDSTTYVASIADDNYAEALSDEIIANGDEYAIFYEIDITQIGIKDTKYGVKETENDIFLVSNVSHNIYYYPGRKINNDIFFSNTYILEK